MSTGAKGPTVRYAAAGGSGGAGSFVVTNTPRGTPRMVPAISSHPSVPISVSDWCGVAATADVRTPTAVPRKATTAL